MSPASKATTTCVPTAYDPPPEGPPATQTAAHVVVSPTAGTDTCTRPPPIGSPPPDTMPRYTPKNAKVPSSLWSIASRGSPDDGSHGFLSATARAARDITAHPPKGGNASEIPAIANVRLSEEKQEIERELIARKLVERAKGILQRSEGLIEEEAYLKLRDESHRMSRPM